MNVIGYALITWGAAIIAGALFWWRLHSPERQLSRQKQDVLDAFQKAQERYQDAKARNDSRDVHHASKALRNAKTAVLRVELGR
jgi:cation transport regulator ChaB